MLSVLSLSLGLMSLAVEEAEEVEERKEEKKKLFDGLDFLARKREKKKSLYFYNTKIY